MKYFVVLTLLLAVSLTGCRGTPQTAPDMIGYVMRIDNAGRILVIDPVAQNFSSTGGVNEFNNAIWFAKAPKSIVAGQKVKVWFDIVRESYPGQSEIEYIEVVPSPKPDGAKLDESQALQKALLSQQPNVVESIVKSIEYNKVTSLWVIKLKELWSDKTHTIEINDKL